MEHNHELDEIYRVEIDAVVRWCPICGAVVVDEDCDNRIAPGAIMKMRFPQSK